MPKIKITHETIRSAARTINQCMDDQKQIIADVAKVVELLKDGWQGEAQLGFSAAFDSARPTYEKFGEDLSKFSQFLELYSGKMEDVDVTGRERFSGTMNS